MSYDCSIQHGCTQHWSLVHLGSYKNEPNDVFTNAQYWQYCDLCIPTYLQFPSLFEQYDISECEIRHQWVLEDYISRLPTQLISNGTAETKLQYWHSCILENILCYREFVIATSTLALASTSYVYRISPYSFWRQRIPKSGKDWSQN